MPLTTFFQSCPICGRGLLIPVEQLGQQIACNHCRGRFQARDTSSDYFGGDVRELSAMDRADALLEYVAGRQLSNRLAAFPYSAEL